MQKAIIFGATDLAEILYNHLIRTPDSPEIHAFAVDAEYWKGGAFCGLPVVSSADCAKQYPPVEYGVYICVGYSGMNRRRHELYDWHKEQGYSILSYVHPSAQIYSDKIGIGTIAFANVLLDVKSQIGDGNIFYPGCNISHHSAVGNFNYFSPEVCVCGHCVIENYCFLGANSTVKDKTSVADKSLVGACAYVAKNTERASVIAPLRSIVFKDKTSLDFL